AKWQFVEDAWSNMEFGLRLGDNPQVVATTTPRPIKLIRELLADERTEKNPEGQTVVTRGHTDENRHNLSDRFVKRVIKNYEGTRLGRQELAGEILDDNPSALWSRAAIDALRVQTKPVDIARIAIGVDPAVADPDKAGKDTEEQTAETGIIVAAITGGPDPHGYILDDKSLRDSPNGWGGAVVDAYKLHSADKIVAEVNNGGALVEFVLQSVAKDRNVRISYKAVHASRGKLIRAEPVAALYEQEKVHHVGTFPVLEDQMCDWEPGMPSPDHLDALVWVLTYLFKLEQQDQKPKPAGVNPASILFGIKRR
ncbi:MAG: terminase family protein, partial [Armatimonadota bacterium]